MTLTSKDQQKLDALKRFFVLDHAPSEDEIGRIVRFTGELFGVAYAFLSLRREDGSENIAAGYGFDADALPPDAIFFQRSDGPSIPIAVADASQDGRFGRNPLVHGEGGARLYAGVPLKSAKGFTLGTLAIMDREAHELNSEGMAMLANVGALVEPVLQLVQSRHELEASASSLAHSQALSAAAVVAADALSLGVNGFSEALAHIGPTVVCPRAALFLHTTGANGSLTATCFAAWNAVDAEPIAGTAATFDFESEGLSSWTAAFAARRAVSQKAVGPFLTAGKAQFVAAIPLASGQTRPGFVLLDRASPWSEAELLGLQIAFGPLAESFRESDGESATELVEPNPVPMVLVTGRDGRLVFANRAAREMLGLEADDVEGRAFIDCASPSDRHLLASLIMPEQQSSPVPSEVHLHDGEGQERLVRLMASTMPFDGQAATLLAWVDVTADRLREGALIAERDRATEVTRAKSAFLARMSHEIRTALTSILGYAEFLADELEADQLDMAQTILGSSERLLQTLNSVMDMERLEAGIDAPLLKPISVGGLVQETTRVFERQAVARELAFICEGVHVPVFVWADEGALTRVLDNLISNALKFTEQGGIRLRVSSDGGQVCLEVQDTGLGMDEAFLPYVFDEYKQEGNDLSRNMAGSGLGLALTRRLVELMGGQIAVTSRKGQGTVFRVTLRAAPAPVSTSVGGDGIEVQEAQASH